jgi:DmsE family decaheme c-type cytochrome
MGLVRREGRVMLMAAMVTIAAAVGCWTPAGGAEAKAGAAKGKANERIGAAVCLQCHSQFEKGWYGLRHNRYRTSESAPEMLQGCEGCHGPGQAHLEDENFGKIFSPKKATGLKAVAMCFQCHETTMKAASWLQTPHAKAGLGCGTCHEMHMDTKQPALLRDKTTTLCLSCHREEEAAFRLNSHHPVLEGRMGCTDCHDPHVGAGKRALLKVNDDKCLRCHLEKRGPFAYEHQTALHAGEASCASCHKPHGSPNPRLGTYYGRGMCLQCHSEIAGDARHRPRVGNCWVAGCHSRFHGSNANRFFLN